MKKILYLILIAIFFCSCSKKATEIPITTSSQEALQLFVDGRENLENLKTADAAELFDEAIQKDPNFAKAYMYRAFSGGGYQIFRKNLDKAVELIDQVSEGEKHEILYTKAGADGDGAQQKAELDTLLQLFPVDKRVHDYAGNYYYYTAQDYDKALQQYQRTIAIDPEYPPVYNSMAYLYIDMNNYDKAEESFQKYIELIPDESNPYDSYAEFLLRQGKHEESIQQYQKAYDTDPSFPIALSGIGNNYIFMGDFEKGREYYQKYFDQAQNLNQKMGAISLKAVSYVHEGKTEEAIKSLEERAALAKEKKSPNFVANSYDNALFVLDEAGESEAAAEYLDKLDSFIDTAAFKEVDRKTAKYYAMVDRFYHYIMNNKLEEANNVAVKCKQLAEERQNPEEIQELNLVLGMLKTKEKNYDQALEHLEGADRESPYTWYWQAVAYEESGNVEKAQDLYKNVANCTDNGMDLAVVREKAKEKV
jgi:tetratricopeptide (TPR) repeat protein